MATLHQTIIIPCLTRRELNPFPWVMVHDRLRRRRHRSPKQPNGWSPIQNIESYASSTLDSYLLLVQHSRQSNLSPHRCQAANRKNFSCAGIVTMHWMKVSRSWQAGMSLVYWCKREEQRERERNNRTKDEDTYVYIYVCGRENPTERKEGPFHGDPRGNILRIPGRC